MLNPWRYTHPAKTLVTRQRPCACVWLSPSQQRASSPQGVRNAFFMMIPSSAAQARRKAAQLASKFPQLTDDQRAILTLYTIEMEPQDATAGDPRGSWESRPQSFIDWSSRMPTGVPPPSVVDFGSRQGHAKGATRKRFMNEAQFGPLKFQNPNVAGQKEPKT